MDEHGYPEKHELEQIATWDFEKRSVQDFLAEIKRFWHWPDWGYRLEKRGHKDILGKPCWKLFLDTGGWSGNESVMEAIEKNFVFWVIAWVSSRRGGHYEFEICPSRFGAKSKRAGKGRR